LKEQRHLYSAELHASSVHRGTAGKHIHKARLVADVDHGPTSSSRRRTHSYTKKLTE
jgi:hypothetical protein